MGNVGYKLVLAELGRPAIERTNTLTTSASTTFYDLPMDCIFIRSVTITVGGIVYVVQEEESQETWNYLHQNSQTSDIPQTYFVRLNYGVGKSELGIYPTPSSASNTITVIYEKMDKDLSNDAYTTGTVTFTNGDATVTGSGTTFTAGMVGRYIKGNDGYWYQIVTFTSTISIEIDKNYEGTTTASVTTAIHELFILPEEMQILPCWYALATYFGMKKDQAQENKYWSLFTNELKNGKNRWAGKTRSSIIRKNKYGSRWGQWAPSNFPTSIT